MDPKTLQFTVPLLVRPEAYIPNNYRQAVALLLGQFERIKRDNNQARADLYRKLMEGFLEQDACYEVNTTTPEKDKAYYSSFRIALNPRSISTPERLCLNGSLGIQSLNKNLHSCPSLLPAIFSMQIKSRLHPVFVVADLSKMFLSCLVHPRDRKWTRIVYKEPFSDKSVRPKVLEFRKLPWGLSSAPFLASSCLQKALEHAASRPNSSPLQKHIAESSFSDFYMDDWSKGFSTTAEAAKYSLELANLLEEYKFKLRKFSSSHSEVLMKLPRDRLAPVTEYLDRQHITSETTANLGYSWNCETDKIIFSKYSDLAENFQYTPRALLSLYASIFDPLQLLGCFVLVGKQLLNDCLQMKLHKDTMFLIFSSVV